VQEVALPAGQFTNWETIGALPGGAQGFVGKVAEIMHFNTILSPQVAAAVEDQMGARYQTPFPDRDGDGLPDWWERALIAERGSVAPLGNADGDQWTNLQEFQAGTHPGLADSDHDGLLDHEEAALGTSPICFDTDRDGYPDGIDAAPLDPSNGRADLDGNGIPDGMDYLLSEDSMLTDTDGDGLSDFIEVYYTFTSPVLFDSDGDLLPDGFEFYNGLNPHNSEGADGQNGDPDGDGLDNFTEYLHQTNPNSADTDGDGVSDAQEIAQGSDPNNSGDGGQPPPVPPVEVPFKVGDPSGSHSERWMMMIEGSGLDTRRFNFAARSWGEVETQSFKLLPGAEYKVTLRHLSTDPQFLGTNEKADYDWTAAIDSKPGVLVEQPGADGTVFVIAKEGAAWVVDNPGGLLTDARHGDDDNLTVGKSARLLPIDIRWEAKPEFANVDDNPDPWTNEINGKRIMVSAPEEDHGGDMRRELNVKVSIPGYANQPVYLKVFDVDDPSTVSDPGQVLDPNGDAGDDNMHPVGLEDNWGHFIPQAAKKITVTLDSSGEATATFKVNQQPGNNYRVAVAIEDADLNVLQVTNSGGQGFVTPDDKAVSGFNGAITPMLTVWRKLHIEVDSMEAVTTPKGSPDRVDAIGDYWVTDTSGLQNRQRLYLADSLPEENNFYEGGRLKAGGAEYKIYESGSNWVTLIAAVQSAPPGFIGPRGDF
jgi:hypothetical protein